MPSSSSMRFEMTPLLSSEPSQVVRTVGETAQSAKARNGESTQSTQTPVQHVDASQVIADMVTGKAGTDAEETAETVQREK